MTQKLISFMAFVLFSVNAAAQAQNTTDASRAQQELESINILEFGFGRAICDIHTEGRDIVCETEMDMEEWENGNSTFENMYTTDDMHAIPGATEDNTEYLCRRINEMTDKDSCCIYMLKGNDALIWTDIMKEKTAIRDFLKTSGGMIRCRIVDSATMQAIAAYNISATDLRNIETVRNTMSERAAKTLYLQCYSAIIGVRLSALTLPLTIDEYTVITKAEVTPGLVAYSYEIDDGLFDNPELSAGLKEHARASLQPAMRLIKHIGYRIKYTYTGKKDKTKTFSFVID